MGKYIYVTTDPIEDVLRHRFDDIETDIPTLLGYCKYYKGEENNPYEDENPNKAMIWFYEKCWVYDMNKHGDGYFHSMYRDYMGAGLKNFEKDDGVRPTLKYLLFNRYCKGCFSMADAVEPFKEFYRMFYLNEL